MKALSASTASPGAAHSPLRPDKSPSAPDLRSLPQPVTGLVLRETTTQTAIVESHATLWTALIAGVIAMMLFSIGWFRDAKEPS